MKLSANAIPLVAYTRREEILNTATHALGLILSGFIFVQCLLPALVAHDRLRIVCGCLYFFGTTLTFLTSVAYHAVSSAERKKVLRLFLASLYKYANSKKNQRNYTHTQRI